MDKYEKWIEEEGTDADPNYKANPEQLNEKIAEWLDIPYRLCGVVTCPNFTTSQDTHGPIIEKLNGEYNLEIKYFYEGDFILCEIHNIDYKHEENSAFWDGLGKTEALAFCLAVEKIIDGE